VFGSYTQCDFCGVRLDNSIEYPDEMTDPLSNWKSVKDFGDSSVSQGSGQEIGGECWEKALIAMTPMQSKKARLDP